MPSAQEVEELLAVGQETRSFEVKGPGSLKDKAYVARIARAMMAMGNRRDGGLVCLGIDNQTLREMRPGLNDRDLAEWSDSDNVNDAIARYSDPPVEFTPYPLTLSTGTRVVVLDVREFDDLPHVGKRDYPEVLQQGQVYVRPRGTPRSVPVPNSGEMRELLDLATDKRLRAFVARLPAAGLVLGAPLAAAPIGDEQFAQEAAAAWENPSDTVRHITSLAHFDVAVHLEPFHADRVPVQDLEQLMTQNTVRLRGWPVPYTSPREAILRAAQWIGQDTDADTVPHLEAWRLCRSAQFLHRRVLATDLRDSPQLLAADSQSSGAVAVWDVLFYLVEIAELGARLSVALGGLPVTFRITLREVKGRELVSGDLHRELHAVYRTSTNALHHTRRVEPGTLAGDARAVGVELAQGLLHQFGLALPDQVLSDWQDQTLRP